MHCKQPLKQLLKDIDAVVFDLDGTLVDSMWIWSEIDREFLASYGIEYKGAIPEIDGMSYTETAVYFKEAYHIPLSIEEIKDVWYRMSVEKYSTEVRLKAHAEEFLFYLKSHNIRTAIATSNSIELTETCLKALKVRELFDFIITADMVNKGKPAPDIYIYAAKQLKAEPERCLAFEDIPAGIMAAERAGMRTVAVYDKASAKKDAEKKALADAFISDYAEMLG